ncbi:MAG: penicillin-binding protein 1A [Alphaproteobacteria bacterium]
MIRFITSILSVLFFCALAGIIVALGIFYYYGSGLPDYRELAEYEPPVVTRMYAGDGRLFAEYAHEKRVFVPIEAIPKRLIDTFLAAEDKNFYDHFGLDFVSIFRSAIQNIDRLRKGLRPIGASTITQQVARNFLLTDTASKVSLERKIKEAILSFRIERAFTKEHILELYLNEIFFGHHSYGVAAAALNYFNKSLDKLTIEEAAFLAGLPKAPSRYSPSRNYGRSKGRRDWVISRMVEEEIITPEEGAEAMDKPLKVRRRKAAEVVRADYFAEEVRRDLLARYGRKTLYEGGFTVRTTLNPRLQNIAEQSLKNGLERYDRRHGWRGPVTRINAKDDHWHEALLELPKPAGLGDWKLAAVLKVEKEAVTIGLIDATKATIPLKELKWARKFLSPDSRGPSITHAKQVLREGDVVMVTPADEGDNAYKLCQVPKASGAIVAMDAHTGRVLAMSGGWSFDTSQFNRATQAMRQTGSVFKPFNYLAAFEMGISPSTIIVDAPVAIEMGYGLGLWKPTNYEDKFFGPTTLRVGLEKSRNIVAIKLIKDYVGIGRLVETARRFGIIENMPRQLAMTLGAGETTLIKMAAAYAIIANGGRRVKPHFVDRVQDRQGRTILKSQTQDCVGCREESWFGQEVPELVDTREQVTDPATAFQVTSILHGATFNGTSRSVRKYEDTHQLAGKTGTSNDFFDAWYIGYEPNGLLVAIYVGYDGPRTLGNRQKEGGAKVCAPIFGEFMAAALKDTPAVPFRIPPGIKLVRVDRETGTRARGDGNGIIVEAFKVGTEVPRAVAVRVDENNNPSAIDSASNLSGTGGMY